MNPSAEQFGRVPSAMLKAGGIRKMSGAASKVYLALATYANAEWLAWPGLEELAEVVGIHPGSIRRAIVELRTAGLIESVDEHTCPGTVAKYRIISRSAGATRLEEPAPKRVAPALPDEPIAQRRRADRVAPALQSCSAGAPPLKYEEQSNGTDPENRGDGTASVLFPDDELKAKSKPRRGSNGAAELPELPGVLAVEPFIAAWSEWRQHRVEIKCPLTPTSANQQLRQLESLGPIRAAATLRQSIACGWRGVFPNNNTQGASNAKHHPGGTRVGDHPSTRSALPILNRSTGG